MKLIEFLNKVAIKNWKLNNNIQNPIWWKSKWFSNWYEEVYQKTSFLNEDVKIVERIYCILNNITEIVKCDYCKKNNVKFRKFSFWYSKNCSQKCAALNPISIEKLKKTCLKKYWTTSTFASKEIRKKAKITCLKKYWTENPMSNFEIRNKISKTKLNFDNEKKEQIKEKIKNKF